MLFHDIKLILKQSGKFIDLGLLLRPDEEWKKCHKIETKKHSVFFNIETKSENPSRNLLSISLHHQFNTLSPPLRHFLLISAVASGLGLVYILCGQYWHHHHERITSLWPLHWLSFGTLCPVAIRVHEKCFLSGIGNLGNAQKKTPFFVRGVPLHSPLFLPLANLLLEDN